jgi:hypothetical protein
MKTGLLLALFVPAALMTAVAFADDKATCLDATSKGQRFKIAHKLVEAREQLLVCAAAACPSVVQADCATWLIEVERALPTVVISAKNDAGAFLVDVKVSVDGAPFASKLDGQSLPVNPGLHTFHFEGASGTSADRPIVVREGEKTQSVAVVLAAASVTPAAPPGGRAPDLASAPSDSGGGASSESGGGTMWGGWKTAGWIVGGAGLVGIGVGAAFGVIAIEDKRNAHCDANNVCDAGTASGIKSAANVSNVGWIAGGVLLAGGAALVLFAPRASHDAAAGLRVAPWIAASGGGMVAGGAW